MTARSPWYSIFAPRPAAEVRLYCLPCAGAGASMYQPWAGHLPPAWELRAIRLPGRHARYREPAFTDCEKAALELADGLGADFGQPYVLFGHSMGALLAYRLVRLLERRRIPPPLLLAVASWTVTGLPGASMPDPAAGDEEFVSALRSLGGVPADVLENSEALALMLPTLRSDFTLCRSYRFQAEPRLGVPLTVMGGIDDRVVPQGELSSWRQVAGQIVRLRVFPGDHFFIRQNVADVVGSMREDVAALGAQGVPGQRPGPAGGPG